MKPTSGYVRLDTVLVCDAGSPKVEVVHVEVIVVGSFGKARKDGDKE